MRRATGIGGAAAVAVASLLVLSGCSGAAPVEPRTTAAPSAAAAVDPGAARAAAFQDPVADPTEKTATARPVRIVIPSIDVDASLLDLVRDADGVLEAPPSTELDKAGWYADGAVPGQTGPAVIAGHVDWVHRVAVFHRLGELRPGAAVRVVMSDGSTVRFAVDSVRTVPKSRFPTASVYGPTPDPQLRVITCGGPWDDARDIYRDNVVVAASLAG